MSQMTRISSGKPKVRIEENGTASCAKLLVTANEPPEVKRRVPRFCNMEDFESQLKQLFL